MDQRSISLFLTASLFALLLALSGCQQTASTTGDTQGSAGQDFGVDDGSIQEVETVDLSNFKTVYFDFDRATIRSDQRANLQTDAKLINENTGLGTITLQGHCDERGSEEYNLALGERRAAAVKRYLANLGVPDGNMRTLSYGESRPAARGTGESVWRWNRRAEFRTR